MKGWKKTNNKILHINLKNLITINPELYMIMTKSLHKTKQS